MYSKTQDMGLYGLSRRDCEGWMNSRYKANRYKVNSINQLGMLPSAILDVSVLVSVFQ